MDPAMFPHQVPEMTAWLCMGFGLVAGVFVSLLIVTWRVPEEDEGGLRNRWGQRIEVEDVSSDGGAGTSESDSCKAWAAYVRPDRDVAAQAVAPGVARRADEGLATVAVPPSVGTFEDVSTLPRGVEGHAGGVAASMVQAGRHNGDTARPDAEELCVVPGADPVKGFYAHSPAARLPNRASVSTAAALNRGRGSVEPFSRDSFAQVPGRWSIDGPQWGRR